MDKIDQNESRKNILFTKYLVKHFNGDKTFQNYLIDEIFRLTSENNDLQCKLEDIEALQQERE